MKGIKCLLGDKSEGVEVRVKTLKLQRKGAEGRYANNGQEAAQAEGHFQVGITFSEASFGAKTNCTVRLEWDRVYTVVKKRDVIMDWQKLRVTTGRRLRKSRRQCVWHM